MAWTKVARASDVPADSAIEVLVNRHPYAICRVDGELHTLDGVCIHRGGPLGHGQIHDGRIVCPFHMWEFDCRTGEYDYDPTKRAGTFATKVQEGDVWIDVP